MISVQSVITVPSYFASPFFTLGEVLDGWYQWRRIFSLLANCEAGVREHSRLYKALITCLYRQLTFDGGREDAKESIADLFAPQAESTEPAFLPTMLSRLFGNIRSNADDEGDDLLERSEGLKKSLERKFGVKFDSIEGDSIDDIAWDTDEAPVIVN